jgi:hypothetical protein
MAANTDDAIAQAARNNAAWCDAIARTHDAGGQFLADLWFSDRKLPLFYPNLVTLTAEGEAVQRDRVAALIEQGPPLPWAVKDSFARLDLTALGFDCLFEASWILFPADGPAAMPADSAIRWRRIGSAGELVAWEKAWRHDLPAGSAALFTPALLDDPALAILAGLQADAIVAGCVLNIAADAVGLSNLFAPEAARDAVWLACRNQAQLFAPGLPIVGYEQGDDLVCALAAGFRELGPLRVWLWTGCTD